MVGPNEILRVIVRFEDYKGKYAYHCHILEHEDQGAMGWANVTLAGARPSDAVSIERAREGSPGMARVIRPLSGPTNI